MKVLLKILVLLVSLQLAAGCAVERQREIESGAPLEFSHSLEDQIGGQIDAGFQLTGFYEDAFGEEENDPLSKYMPTFIATRAVKP